jgi:hypothetical protein
MDTQILNNYKQLISAFGEVQAYYLIKNFNSVIWEQAKNELLSEKQAQTETEKEFLYS